MRMGNVTYFTFVNRSNFSLWGNTLESFNSIYLKTLELVGGHNSEHNLAAIINICI